MDNRGQPTAPLSPQSCQAIWLFWLATRAGLPVRRLFLEARELVEYDLFSGETMSQIDEIICSSCGKTKPNYDFITTTGATSKRCDDCRKAQGALAWAGRGKAVALAAPPGLTSNGLVTLRLTPGQVEALAALVLREIVRDPKRLAEALPTLLDLAAEAKAER